MQGKKSSIISQDELRPSRLGHYQSSKKLELYTIDEILKDNDMAKEYVFSWTHTNDPT